MINEKKWKRELKEVVGRGCLRNKRSTTCQENERCAASKKKTVGKDGRGGSHVQKKRTYKRSDSDRGAIKKRKNGPAIAQTTTEDGSVGVRKRKKRIEKKFSTT